MHSLLLLHSHSDKVAKSMRKEEPIVQLETAKKEVKKPFAFENELKEKTERLNAFNIKLNLNEKDNSVIDDEPKQNGKQPEKKCTDRERLIQFAHLYC